MYCVQYIKVRHLFYLFIISGLLLGCGGGGGGDGNNSGRGESDLTITSTDPADGASDVPVDRPVTVVFSKGIDPATVTGSDVLVSIEGNSLPGTLSCSDAVITFTPSPALSQGTTYTASVTAGVKDLSGHRLSSAHTWTFTTASAVLPLGKWKDVAAGWDNGMALNENGTLWTWGCNYSGQLGTGTGGDQSEEHLYDSFTPVQVGSGADWQSISAGRHFMHAIKTNATLWAWGQGYLGNVSFALKKSPVQIGSGADWACVDGGVGYLYASAIKTDGTLWTWGNNAMGQLGNGTGGDGTDDCNTPSPAMIGSDADWIMVSAGGSHAVALKRDGTLWAWGANESGQLGDGTTVLRNAPKRVGSDTDWVFAAAGLRFTIAIKRNGTLWAWGNNASGQLGDETTASRSIPVRIGTSSDWLTAAPGFNHTVAIRQNGTLWAWGSNTFGQLGDGTGGDGTAGHNCIVPRQIGEAADWKAAASGEDFTIALKTDGTLWSWGLNEFGRLGDGTNVNRNVPVPVGTP